MTQRFGQGIAVDRNRPHIFHRDYWILRVVRQAVRDFVRDYGAHFRGKKALDYGCGVSPYAPWFETVDVKLLKADIKPDDPNVLSIDPETGRVPLPDGSLAAVISTQVLEHVPNVRGYLAEALRLLEPGGRLLLSTHGAFVLHRAPMDLRRWTVDGLQYEVEQAGFCVEEIVPKIGILATATHLRSITYGGLTHRIRYTGWLRPIIYFFHNIRMGIEDALTPASVMPAHPEIIIVRAIKP